MYILVIQPGGLSHDTEITMSPDLGSQNRTPEGHPDSVSFSLDLKPEGLKFDIYAPALLKVHYTDSFIEALARQSNMIPQEAESGVQFFIPDPDSSADENVYIPLPFFGRRDMRNNILVLEMKEFWSNPSKD